MISEIATAILNQVQTDVPALQACIKYPDFDGATLLPAFVLDTNTTFDVVQDEGAEQLCLKSAWRGYVVYDPVVTDSYVQVRELVLTVSQAIYQASRFGIQMGNATISSIYEDTTRTELAGKLVWVIDWTHDIRLGTSVWDGTGVIPTEVYFSYEPDALPLGSEHELL